MAVRQKSPRIGLLSVVFVALLWAYAPAYSGDEDSEPAYKIYIDPDTGKYTTEDPDAAVSDDPVLRASKSSEITRFDGPLLIVVTILLVVVFVAGILRHQRKPLF